MSETTDDEVESMPLANLNDLSDESLEDGRDLLRGERAVNVQFNGTDAELSFNDDGEESFYLSTPDITIYFTHVERCGARSYFLKQPGAISATVDFTEHDDVTSFEEVLRFLCE